MNLFSGLTITGGVTISSPTGAVNGAVVGGPVTYVGSGVTVGTTNGSPFGSSVNSYQLASQPGSAPFNCLTIPGSSGFAFGTGSFTIEWFQYETDGQPYPRVFWYTSSAGASYPTCGVDLEGTFYFWNASAISLGNAGTTASTWVHYAVVRNGASALAAYRNGVSIGTGTDSTNYTDTTSTLYIGSKSNGGAQSEQFSGSITNIRICKGVAVYTGAFTKPTSALQATQSANPYGGSNTSAITSGQCVLLLEP